MEHLVSGDLPVLTKPLLDRSSPRETPRPSITSFQDLPGGTSLVDVGRRKNRNKKMFR